MLPEQLCDICKKEGREDCFFMAMAYGALVELGQAPINSYWQAWRDDAGRRIELARCLSPSDCSDGKASFDGQLGDRRPVWDISGLKAED